MALIKCKECGKECSSSANACPHCGYDLKKALEQEVERESAQFVLAVTAIIGFLFIAGIGWLFL